MQIGVFSLRLMALLLFEINKISFSNEFREVGNSLFFPSLPTFLGNLFAKLGLSSRVILIRLLVSRVIAFYGPCWRRSYANWR